MTTTLGTRARARRTPFILHAEPLAVGSLEVSISAHQVDVGMRSVGSVHGCTDPALSYCHIRTRGQVMDPVRPALHGGVALRILRVRIRLHIRIDAGVLEVRR